MQLHLKLIERETKALAQELQSVVQAQAQAVSADAGREAGLAANRCRGDVQGKRVVEVQSPAIAAPEKK